MIEFRRDRLRGGLSASRSLNVAFGGANELSGKYDRDIEIDLAGHLSNFFPFGDKHFVRYARSRRSYDLIGSFDCVIDVTKLAHNVAHHNVNALDALLNLTAATHPFRWRTRSDFWRAGCAAPVRGLRIPALSPL